VPERGQGRSVCLRFEQAESLLRFPRPQHAHLTDYVYTVED
jgi:hypothetical protein